jgi:putative spermidine/putrescine transport system permease protein
MAHHQPCAVDLSGTAEAPSARGIAQYWGVGLLVLPVLIFLAALFYIPALNLLSLSFFSQNNHGAIQGPLSFKQYERFFADSLYVRVLWTTVRISLITSVVAMVLAFPVARVINRSSPAVAHLINLIVIAPLLVSVVVRGYGWQIILANGPTGALNWVLLHAGLIRQPLSLMYTDTAVVIGSLHVFFPMMLLPVNATMQRISPSLEDAARVLGASSLQVIRRVVIPLSAPGFVLGFAFVFALTAGSFVIPTILGGKSSIMIGNLIEQQIFVVYDRPFGATMAVMLIAIALLANLVAGRLAARSTILKAAA